VRGSGCNSPGLLGNSPGLLGISLGGDRGRNIKTVVKVDSRTEYSDRSSTDTRFYISSAPLDIERIARAARDHWGVESMHWLLDVEFQDDLSRYRTGHGAKNMAVVRRFALNLVRANKTKGSIKTRRKRAGWRPEFLLQIPRNDRTAAERSRGRVRRRDQ
jgi:predicted transposase YbfD/YdcC